MADDEVYDGRTYSFQHEWIDEQLKAETWLASALGTKWCSEELLFKERRPWQQVHPLFYRLGAPETGKRIVRNLDLLRSNVQATKFTGFLNKLKKDRQNVPGMLNNLEAYSYLHRRGVKVVWEPAVPSGHTKHPDLGILGESNDCFVEVVTMLDDDIDRRQDELKDNLRARVNTLPDNPYDISASFNYMLDEEDVEKVISFINETVLSGQLKKEESSQALECPRDEHVAVGTITFSYAGGKRKGCWMMSGGPALHRFDIERIRKKLLRDKLAAEKFQLPPRPAIGGMIVCLEGSYLRRVEVVDAIRGSPAIIFSTNGGSRLTRKEDGLIHDERAKNIGQVDFVLVVDNPREEWRPERMLLLNNQDGALSRERTEQLFIK